MTGCKLQNHRNGALAVQKPLRSTPNTFPELVNLSNLKDAWSLMAKTCARAGMIYLYFCGDAYHLVAQYETLIVSQFEVR